MGEDDCGDAVVGSGGDRGESGAEGVLDLVVDRVELDHVGDEGEDVQVEETNHLNHSQLKALKLSPATADFETNSVPSDS